VRERPIDRVILVPGLLEPHAMLWFLKRRLQTRCDHVDLFPDRIIFRSLEQSIARLSGLLCDEQASSIGVVTHSFGDWVARQAIARSPEHRVRTMVSVAPAMRAGTILRALRAVSGKSIPEITVITNPDLAMARLDCDARVKRLVIWAKFDGLVRPVPLDSIEGLQVLPVAATHLSVVMQPNVLKMIESTLFPADGSA